MVQYLRDRMDVMKKAMLKPPGRPNTLFDSSVLEKLQDPEQRSRAGACCAVLCCAVLCCATHSLRGSVTLGKGPHLRRRPSSLPSAVRLQVAIDRASSARHLMWAA